MTTHPKLQSAINRLQEASKHGIVHPRTATRAWQLLRIIEQNMPDAIHCMSLRSMEMSGAMGNVVLTFKSEQFFVQAEVPVSGPVLWFGNRHSFETSWTAEEMPARLPVEAVDALREIQHEVRND